MRGGKDKGGGGRTEGVQFFAGLFAGFGVAGGDVYFCSVHYEAFGDHAAYAFSSASDEDNLVLLRRLAVCQVLRLDLLAFTLNKLVASMMGSCGMQFQNFEKEKVLRKSAIERGCNC